MKKTILTLSITIISLIGFSQNTLVFSNNGTYEFGRVTGSLGGSITLTTSANFNGTTTSDSLFYSNDNVNWAPQKYPDGTYCVILLTAASTTYSFDFASFQHAWYKHKYTTNGSHGVITSIINRNQ